MRTIIGLICAAATACSSSTTAEPSGPCAQRHGSYDAKYTARSGDCGASAESVSKVDKQPTSVDAPCTGTIEYSADNCEVTYETTCPADSVEKGAHVKVSGKAKWNHDASQGTAVESWFGTDATGKAICQGTYDVTITRQ